MKRYRDLNTYLKEIYGERVQKISLDAGLICPNRDGTISRRGCLFCDSRGSGTGAFINQGLSIHEQILKGRQFAEKRYGARKYIAYFQSFSNTYGTLSTLQDLYDEALDHPGMVGLSVATRPDCVHDDVLRLMNSYREDYMVWLELGLQSAHDVTLIRINRGHDVACFGRSVRLADEFGLNTCAHIILGLPGETRQMMLDTAIFLSRLPVMGVKIHLLYIIRDTPLAKLYRDGQYDCLERDEYVDLVVEFLELLPPSMVIHRLTGDPMGAELVAPLWAKDKGENLRCIRGRLRERATWQGRLYVQSIAGRSDLKD